MSENIKNRPVVPAQLGALPPGYGELLDDLNAIVKRSSIRAQRAVNTELIQMYWELGRTILERQSQEAWGTKVIDRIAVDMRTAFPGQRGFSRSNLKYMQQMARTWPEQIGQQAVGQLPWGHIIVLMGRLDTPAEQDFYAKGAVQHGWSRGMLEHWISHRLHLTQGAAASNFAATVPEGSKVIQEIVELKTKEARPEHIGKLGFYVGVVDRLVRDPERDDATLGILIGASHNQGRRTDRP